MAKQDEVYEALHRGANADGFIETCGATLSMALNLPQRTVYGHLEQLEAEGKIFKLEYRRYAVTALVD